MFRKCIVLKICNLVTCSLPSALRFPKVIELASFDVVPTFESVPKILERDNSNENYREVLFCRPEIAVVS